MKRVIIRTATMVILLTGLLLTSPAVGQNGSPPPPPGTHGEDDNQPPGGGVPVGSGVAILLSLGAAYGWKKAFEARKRE